jgi:hypothetical protein
MRLLAPSGAAALAEPFEIPQKEQHKVTDTDQPASKFFTFTVDATTGQIVKFETFDASGVRHELSEQERANLAQAGSEGLEVVLEEAFEAGIDCVLGDEEGTDETEESKEETELRQMLLSPLIKHSRAKHLLQREVLSRAILGTLLGHSVKAGPTVSSRSPTAGAESGAEVGTRAN